MNQTSPRQLLAYLAAIFLIGAAAGSIGGYSWGKRTIARWPDRSKMREKIQAKITADFNLTQEQVAKLEPLLDSHMEESKPSIVRGNPNASSIEGGIFGN